MAEDDLYLIKRYSNRKLYDSVRRRFTTLDEIAALLDGGIRVVVRDHDGGADRTDEVLAQVLRRRAQSRPGSSSLLADLLRTPTGVVQGVAQLADIGQVAGATGAAQVDEDEDEPPAPPKKAKKKSKKKPAPAPVDEDDASDGAAASSDSERQQEEIRELREQVSQLTQAVTLLLQEKTGDKPDE
ncbi:polyhydroxyalkanoate synthesis regulator DNA-binding domain-containing protein [Tsukamurella sp. 8F]|uniref:polyhydroxyalkanoate synthesis regulator DNA-binding domain-containing protein n=1 Tax=unclassified Tsukamurella TaxID=2633480 RepID=UPI0023B8C59E|nr:MULTISPECIES: polyhydroxyalkanoate synthesis regulator DNA-binding domain-containing protein [unclassified Tsukamurella]MDF0532366.1 polyhydroxyalkanoate synthesis regulator DNA-binding domain-containing protein [Tsukamurella sp. 8J]MDF0589374.1 polyhydroxyalkanoate synthesis regulator DNA-binding domain-containing protein [Tsukamurella sp. 8F]